MTNSSFSPQQASGTGFKPLEKCIQRYRLQYQRAEFFVLKYSPFTFSSIIRLAFLFLASLSSSSSLLSVSFYTTR